jgi:hypothetical protein
VHFSLFLLLAEIFKAALDITKPFSDFEINIKLNSATVADCITASVLA